MIHQKTKLFHNRSSSKEFLFYKTDAKLKKDTGQTLSSVETNRILKTFPDILVGKTFIKNALTKFETSEKFESMVIKIDGLNHENSETAGNDPIDIWLDVAKVIDSICRRENGMWGRLDQKNARMLLLPDKSNVFLGIGPKNKKNPFRIYR